MSWTALSASSASVQICAGAYSNAILAGSSRVGFGGMGCAPHLSDAFAHPMSRLFGSALLKIT